MGEIKKRIDVFFLLLRFISEPLPDGDLLSKKERLKKEESAGGFFKTSLFSEEDHRWFAQVGG